MASSLPAILVTTRQVPALEANAKKLAAGEGVRVRTFEIFRACDSAPTPRSPAQSCDVLAQPTIKRSPDEGAEGDGCHHVDNRDQPIDPGGPVAEQAGHAEQAERSGHQQPEGGENVTAAGGPRKRYWMR